MPKTKGNINLENRPVVRVGKDYGTVRSMSINEDGNEILIPTIRAGLDRPMTNQEAIAWYKQTGQHLGKFSTPDEATAYAEQLHQSQAKQYAPQIERKRVDDFIQTRLLEQQATAIKKKPQFDYPLPIALLGKGFRNLYDVLRQQSIKEE